MPVTFARYFVTGAYLVIVGSLRFELAYAELAILHTLTGARPLSSLRSLGG